MSSAALAATRMPFCVCGNSSASANQLLSDPAVHKDQSLVAPDVVAHAPGKATLGAGNARFHHAVAGSREQLALAIVAAHLVETERSPVLHGEVDIAGWREHRRIAVARALRFAVMVAHRLP